MSAPTDIQALLAALAAQKPDGSQSQHQQATNIPSGFADAARLATPPTHLGGLSLPLPQPNSSGSLDLSAIKPVDSGQVNIADAIARAKDIAAQRGTSIDDRSSAARAREDPRLSGRSYRRSRSRSRSPGRRGDAYRDSFNPYRDERRDESRRGSNPYGRDRSYSPPNRGRGTFSPSSGSGYGRERSPVRDHATETLTIDSRMVGLIIGRGGENLNRVERETGARVQFVTGPEGTGPRRQCKISGTRRQRDDAKREIYQVIDENSGNRSGAKVRDHQPALREGENSIQIMVPDKTVGLIIGRGGETIRDLQERSGCHVNIVGENKSANGMRPVNLIGSYEAAEKAKKMIDEIVDSDTSASVNNQRQQQRPDDIFFDGGQIAGGDDKVTESMKVPSDAVGMIIGKAGETIKEMQRITGCKINCSAPKNPDHEREIGLVGTRQAIENAKRAIWEKVDSVRDRSGRAGRGGREPDHYGGNYSQQQQPAYGASAGAPGNIPAQAPAAANTDPNNDPYAAYGGYQAYAAWYYSAMMQNQGQAGQMPPGSGGAQGPPGT